MKTYIPFTQQPYLCVAACLQMVLQRRGFELVEQEVIANELGLIVPEEDTKLFAHARTGEKPSSGWGTQIQDEQYSVQRLFDAYGWPLTFERHSIKSRGQLRDLLLTVNNNDDLDAMVCFDYGVLWEQDYHGGHVCIVEKIKDDVVHIIDPERNVPKRRQVNIGQLFNAVDVHGEQNAAGVWLVRSKGAK